VIGNYTGLFFAVGIFAGLMAILVINLFIYADRCHRLNLRPMKCSRLSGTNEYRDYVMWGFNQTLKDINRQMQLELTELYMAKKVPPDVIPHLLDRAQELLMRGKYMDTYINMRTRKQGRKHVLMICFADEFFVARKASSWVSAEKFQQAQKDLKTLLD